MYKGGFQGGISEIIHNLFNIEIKKIYAMMIASIQLCWYQLFDKLLQEKASTLESLKQN